MTFSEQLKKIVRSRKFWVLIAALLATIAACVAGQIDIWQALQAGVAALAVYSTGVAIEDNGNTTRNAS
jgi:Mg/Co/Ni transporter MgtE